MEDLQAEILSLYNRIDFLERQAATRDSLMTSLMQTAREVQQRNHKLVTKCRHYERQLGMTPITH